MNDHDSVVLSSILEHAGHYPARSAAEADLILLNTCAIREKAAQKVYSQLGRYKVLKQRRPELILGVGGCLAQSDGRKVLSRAPYVDLVFGTQTVGEVPELVEKVRTKRRRVVSVGLAEDPDRIESFYAHTRPNGLKTYVTVMQGCDNFCAYCIVPHVRGRDISRPAGELVREVERLAGGGVREVTLLGQNVNSYGRGGEVDFAGLVRRVAGVEGIRRIRFTTSHPKDLSDELMGLFGDEPKLMPHIHLPLQSGSDRILSAMNRRYTLAHYVGLVDRLREVRPGIAVTSDMIVGFPGEREEDFRATLEAMERVIFDGLFSFKFSPRPGTAAAGLPDTVPEPEKEERLARLQSLQNEHALRRNRQWVGSVRRVLVEGRSKEADRPARRNGGGVQLTGRTPENKIANFAGDQSLLGVEVPVRISAASLHSLAGERADARPEGREETCTCA
ncbi:MAG: tRNA (N6-isopentenyl adenosine(37)-C2)-methylthiotransferase MiaB [Deltaproteobacteria bacterium]|nr:tRNA (N6-isopentenyl adenosine(37)-C2)-methylthiotransferase MiaB [Deltaproteobacteria bacterium]